MTYKNKWAHCPLQAIIKKHSLQQGCWKSLKMISQENIANSQSPHMTVHDISPFIINMQGKRMDCLTCASGFLLLSHAGIFCSVFHNHVD